MFNLDKSQFGYYQIGDYKTFSKIDAIEIEARTGKTITWHFNDEIYSCYDWTKEPTESIEELYMARARQIREKYDYLVLFYSGGSDSHNMLMSFVHAGVPVDEIVSLSYYQGDGDKQSFMNKESFETALPFAEHLKETNPVFRNTLVTELDISYITRNLFDRVGIHDLRYYSNTVPSVNNMAKTFIRETHPRYQQLIKDKKLAFVWGSEKPLQIWFEQGKFYFQFTDLFGCCVGARTQDLNRAEEHDELFYSTPDNPKIAIKMCHLVKNFLTNSSVPNPWLSNTEPSSLGHIPKWHDNRWQTFWLTKNGSNFVVYPWFDSSLYSQPKITNLLYSDRDIWFYKHPDADPYHEFVSSMTQQFGEKWIINDSENDTIIVRKFYSKPYCLTK